MSDSDTVRPEGEARTGQVTVLRLAPFAIEEFTVADRWDPPAGPLGVSWTIRDPNRRIRRGRLVYTVLDPDGRQVEVAVLDLDPGELEPGTHQLAQERRWDGMLPAAAGARAGSRVTIDLAPYVRLMVWSTDAADPAEPAERPSRAGQARPTERPGEWQAERGVVVMMDCLVEARWSRSFCVPYPDQETLFAEERRLGEVAMRIRVKNVAPDATVSIAVHRIVDPANPANDDYYAGSADDGQPGLDSLEIRGDLVVRADGSLPAVRFNDHAQHWVDPARGFYCFRVGFGQGPMVQGTPRDPAAAEADCLHLRFTVLVHHPSRDLRDSATECQELIRLFQRSRYFRVYYQGAGQPDAARLAASYRHRYLIIFSGHGWAGCSHPEHPTLTGRPTPDDPLAEGPGPRLDLLHEGFDPDQDWCPPPNAAGRASLDRQARRASRHWDERYRDVMTFGWCQHREGITHQLTLGRASGATGQKIWLGGVPPDQIERAIDAGSSVVWLGNDQWFVWLNPAEAPRLAFFADACRSVLGNGLAYAFNRSGTRFYHGWHYSVDDGVGMMEALVRRWLPAPAGGLEGDPDRLVEAYQAVASAPNRARFHPRLVENGQIIPATAATSQAAGAVR